jgi:hypothetical protein
LHAQKVVDVLLSERYINEFKTFLAHADLDPTDKIVKDLMGEKHGVDVPALLQDFTPIEAPSTVETDHAVAEHHEIHHAPHFNIAHQMMTEAVLTDC